ncbi:hypothetical protein CEXT_633381 [Caerostris extrusa]|uniref:Uncharacterized protein n=1 Tax=Caerostris extrusa TaxID=172846 RepID=A0AAV4PT14_CAEEX|nr:hypothetical protein CEXT_633381 [Caerostris extrusa]
MFYIFLYRHLRASPLNCNKDRQAISSYAKDGHVTHKPDGHSFKVTLRGNEDDNLQSPDAFSKSSLLSTHNNHYHLFRTIFIKEMLSIDWLIQMNAST